MRKFYICFKDENERNAFILAFLDIKISSVEGNGKRKTKRKSDWKDRVMNFLNLIDVPRKTNPYYKLNNRFYRGYLSPGTDISDPLSPASIFVSGVRSLYTQSSYENRPGSWLVVDLRNTEAGRSKMSWIERNVPRERMGENVPLPDSARYQKKLKWVQEILEAANGYKFALEALDCLKEIKEKQPLYFKGKKVYIWGDMARLFDTMDDLNHAAYCYRMQGELMQSSDPYLNLGNLFHSRGYIKEAHDAYKQGLVINPGDEYIYYNLSMLMMHNGRSENALKTINAAILENPDRGLNHKQKGDIHFRRHEYYQAIASYKYALCCFDEKWASIAKECMEHLKSAYEHIGDLDAAAEIATKLDNMKYGGDKVAIIEIREWLIKEVMTKDGLTREEAEVLVDTFR